MLIPLRSCLCFALILITPGWLHAQEKVQWEFSGSVAQRYVAMGEEVDPESGAFLFTSLIAQYPFMALGLWHGQSFDRNYNELSVFAESTWERGPWSAFAGINYLRYPASDEQATVELYAGIDRRLGERFRLYLQATRDVVAVDVGIALIGMEVSLLPESAPDHWELSLFTEMGYDFGNHSDGSQLHHHHLHAGIHAARSIGESWVAFGAVHLCKRQDAEAGDGSPEPMTWVEAGFSRQF
jgi:hypothetical protein